MTVLLVIARYSESINWLRYISIPYIVYNKGEQNLDNHLDIRNIPNIGREERVYLQYIVDEYENLPDRIIFSQADPFIHSPDFINLVHYHNLHQDVQPLSFGHTIDNPEPIFREQTKKLWINDNQIHIDIYDTNLNRFAVHNNNFSISPLNRVLKKDFSDYFGTTDFIPALNSFLQIKHSYWFNETQVIPVNYSATFSVVKERILRYPKSYYENLLSIGNQIDNEDRPKALLGWIMEYSWLNLFQYEVPWSIYDIPVEKKQVLNWWNNV